MINGLSGSRELRIITIVFLLVSSSSFADIYKCNVNGEQVFSDQPCTRNAEKVELKVYQPKAEDINQQQRATKRYIEDSQYDEIDALRKKNKSLKVKIHQLIKQRNKKVQLLNEKVYEYSDTIIASSDPNVFKNIEALNAEYLRKIDQLEAEIHRNELRMSEIKLLIDAKH